MELNEVVVGGRVKIKRVDYNRDDSKTYAREGVILRKTYEDDKVLVGVTKPKNFEGHTDHDENGNTFRNYVGKGWFIHIVGLTPID